MLLVWLKKLHFSGVNTCDHQPSLGKLWLNRVTELGLNGVRPFLAVGPKLSFGSPNKKNRICCNHHGFSYQCMYSCMIFIFTYHIYIYQVFLAQLPFFMKVFGRDPSTLENSRTFSSMGHSYPIYSLRQVGPTKDIFLVLVGLVEMATSGTISANGESSVQRLIRALKAFRCFRMIRPTSCFQRWGERENR